jgi:hypothetical protein
MVVKIFQFDLIYTCPLGGENPKPTALAIFCPDNHHIFYHGHI